MSGSDPTVRVGNGGGAGGTNKCILRFTTVLASPDPDVVASVTDGQLLDIVRVDEPIRVIVAKTLFGEIVGAVSREIITLRACIDEGHTYEAEVIQAAGGSVTVEVRNQ